MRVCIEAANAMVLKHQAISIHNTESDHHFIYVTGNPVTIKLFYTEIRSKELRIYLILSTH